MTPHALATFEAAPTSEKGARCAECFSRLCAELESVGGVERVECDQSGAMRVEYDPTVISEGDLRAEAARRGAELEAVVDHAVWRIGGLDCPDCARTVARSVELVPGVTFADLNFASATLLVEHDAGSSPARGVVRAIEAAGHTAEAIGGTALDLPAREVPASSAWLAANRTQIAVYGSGGLALMGWLAGLLLRGTAAASAVSFALYVLAVIAGEVLLGPRALASVKARMLDMNVLMTIAVIGALALGQAAEAASVVFLFALGGMLEARALARTRGSIGALMELAPALVRVRRGGALVEVAPGDVFLGETVVLRPGERVALDGVVVQGESAVDESAITGESVPVAKQPGDEVFSGSLNASGLLEMRVTRREEDSTLARIVYLVEEAQAARAPVQLLVDRVSRVYTPVAVGIAVVLATGAPLLGMLLGPAALPYDTSWHTWLYRGLVVLVAACPCALVISTPVTFVSAIARAGRDGLLVKGGAYLERAAVVDAIALDKTGTLTAGHPEVTAVVPLGGSSEDAVMRFAASLEAHSTHPLARAIARHAAELNLDPAPVEGFTEEFGRGVSGTMEGSVVQLLSPVAAQAARPLPAQAAEVVREHEAAGRTVLVALREGEPVGLVALSDPTRPGTRAVLASLEAYGIRHAIMLTGDNERTAAAVAAQAGVSEYRAGLMPADKVDAIMAFKREYGVVAMVGDGVNDAPALAAADIGIAMGAAGSDTALETADVALLGDDLSALPKFFALGRRTVGIVRANVAFSVVTKVAVLVLAAFGHANMWLAVFADTGVALLVIANGMRLLAGGSAGKTPVRSEVG